MGYISDIRKMVGHAPLMACAAGALIMNEQGQVLLQRRSDDGNWGNPGGSMDLGESAEETLQREIMEETGLTITHSKFFKMYSGKDGYVKYPNGDEVYYVNVIYIVDGYEGTVKVNDNESLELKFFDIDAIPEKRTDLLNLIVRDLKNGE